MTYSEYSEKLETLKYLVERKQAGTPADLSKKLCLTERTVLRMVQRLRENGFPIIFNRNRGSYEINDQIKEI